MEIKAHYDGKVFIPDEPLSMPAGSEVTLSIGPRTQAPPAKTAADLLKWLREEHDPSAWADIGDPSEYARQLRDESNRTRYEL